MNVISPKDPYTLRDIDLLISRSLGYHMLSFIDAYSRYNQIRVNLLDSPNFFFMLNHGNYYYNVIPFRLKNDGATYQRLMDVVFPYQIG